MLAFGGEFSDLFIETKRPGAGFCRVWRLTLSDASEILMTDHNRDLTIPDTSGASPPNDETFIAMAGFSPTALRSSIGGVVDTVNAELIPGESIPESAVIRGLLDQSEIRIGVACWDNPSAGVWWNFRGIAGQVEAKDGTIDIQWRKLTDYMTRPHGRAYLAECDVLEFGDARCGLDIVAAGFVQTGTVTAVGVFADGAQNDRVFEISVSQADGWFQFGKVEFTSGLNVGWSAEIIGHSSDLISLIAPPGYAVTIGDQITVTRGCPRTWEFCDDTVDNLINFKGFGARKGEKFHFMPSDEILGQTPNAK